MTDSAARIRGLLADVERVAAAFENASGGTEARVQEARVQEALGQLEEARQAERGARTRAERAERATAILREEREVIRGALSEVAEARKRR